MGWWYGWALNWGSRRAGPYHDQAHMTREFRVLAGITPAAYRVAALPGYLGIPDAAGSQSRLG
jgi:hypothetical protein